jgi:hypothetical protein
MLGAELTCGAAPAILRTAAAVRGDAARVAELVTRQRTQRRETASQTKPSSHGPQSIVPPQPSGPTPQLPDSLQVRGWQSPQRPVRTLQT